MERLVLSWIDKPLAFELRPGLNRLGRNPTNDFRVPDASVSSFHCEVTLEPDNSVRIRDLATTNGTYIDEQPAVDGRAVAGQTIRMGSVSFRLEWVHVAETIPTPIPERALAMAGGSGESDSTFFRRITQTLRLPFKR